MSQSQIATQAMPIAPDRPAGRSRAAKQRAAYRATLARCCHGEPTPAERLLVNLGAELLARVDTIDRRTDHLTYVALVDGVAEMICLLAAPQPRGRPH